VASSFNMSDHEFLNIMNFIMGRAGDIIEKSRVLIIDNNNTDISDELRHLFCENLKGRLIFLNISSTNSFILRYSGNEDLYLNGQSVLPEQTYIFDNGSSIRGQGIKTVYYSEVAGIISESLFGFKIRLDANNVCFNFRNSNNGIHDLNFHEESGKLVGILGGSGAGKSTTLSVLNGTLEPQKGEVLINGYNLYDETERDKLNGVIGFVPQDDLLIEDLTVFQNIWFNAKLCLNNLSDEGILDVVNRTLFDFDLNDIRDLKVGNPLKKIISGGQRKRVNIALELLREPTILFVDEPTSGLSSVDSEIVMSLLKDQTYKGRLVIVNIHQPGSDIYKMFDRIMIVDKGGYQVYYGNPTEAIVYFKTITNHANKDEDQCVKCGNVNTDQLLQIIEAKVIDEHGRATRIRKVSPGEWAEKFREKISGSNESYDREKVDLPANNYSIPGLLKQSKIYFSRDLLSKLADSQYLAISLLGPPLLSLLLAWFTKSSTGSIYRFRENDNITVYLFTCIITSLFFGLMISSEEIVKDRKILKRESFLNLSWFSYLNSKVVLLFVFSAIQTISFVIIGNFILEIKGMTMSYWLILFATSCFANLLGLNLSSAFNSVISIYILIPFIIIPQLLFSGVMVKYDKLHLTGLSSHEYVPIIGDLMMARWSFEALATEQFKNNGYEKFFFRDKLEESQNEYYASFLINKLKNDLVYCSKYADSSSYRTIVKEKLLRTDIYTRKLSAIVKAVPGEWEKSLNFENFNSRIKDDGIKYLDSIRKVFLKLRSTATERNNVTGASLKEKLGDEGFMRLRDNYENKNLIFIVLNEEPGEKTVEKNDKIIQKFHPGYMKATSKYGRAHFYAPVKMLGSIEIDTYWFNFTVIWLVTIFLYLALYFNLLQKLTSFLGNLRVPLKNRE
jgi:ABC transport system ATP-binding/permease protein